MASTMLNFGGKITATSAGKNNGSLVIPESGNPDSAFVLNTERTSGTVVIIFSTVLNNRSNSIRTVNLWLVRNENIDKKVAIGSNITVVPQRPLSLDYKINLTANDAVYVTVDDNSDTENPVDITISAVSMPNQ